MNIRSERFKEEWEYYKKDKGFSSIEQILKYTGNPMEYRIEDISRFKSGKKKLYEDDINFFAETFKIRKEYLLGIDSYRTSEDMVNAIKNKKDISFAFHQILVSLGYADLDMENDDYNGTFPENTRYFIEALKKELKDKKVTVIFDVNKDEYIAMHDSIYNSLILDVIDYIKFKMTRFFLKSEPVPSVILDDNSTPLHPKTSFKLKDGRTVEVEIRYTPTSQLNNETINNTFIITEHPPTID